MIGRFGGTTKMTLQRAIRFSDMTRGFSREVKTIRECKLLRNDAVREIEYVSQYQK